MDSGQLLLKYCTHSSNVQHILQKIENKSMKHYVRQIGVQPLHETSIKSKTVQHTHIHRERKTAQTTTLRTLLYTVIIFLKMQSVRFLSLVQSLMWYVCMHDIVRVAYLVKVLLVSKCVLSTVRHVQKTIFIFVFSIDSAH